MDKTMGNRSPDAADHGKGRSPDLKKAGPPT